MRRTRRASLAAGVIGARRWWRALVAAAATAAVAAVAFPLLSGGSASAQQGVPVSCQRSGSLYACSLNTADPVTVPVTFEQIADAVKAAGGTINVADPAMWITAWGGNGSNGSKCEACVPDGGAGGHGGYAQTAVSPATFEAVYGSDALYYAIGRPGQGAYSGGGGSGGGFGGGGTVVSASPPSVSSPAEAPPFSDVVVVAGGGGGGGGGGSGHSGHTAGRGGTAVSTFTKRGSTAGEPGGGSGSGKGGNNSATGSGGPGGCGYSWCDGAPGVGGFGGFSGLGNVGATTALYDYQLQPALDPNNSWEQVPVQTPGMGGGSGKVTYSGTSPRQCSAYSSAYLACGGGGGGGYGGGGAGDFKTTTGDGGLAGGGGGSYAAEGTCNSTGAPTPGLNRSSTVIVFVDPDQDCSSSLGALGSRSTRSTRHAPLVGQALARVVRPRSGAVSPRASWLVVVALVRRARITKVRLNGRDVTSRLHRGPHRRWRATLRGRVGENTLVVGSSRGSRRWYTTVHFIRVARRAARLVTTRLRARGGALRWLVRHRSDASMLTGFTLRGRRIGSGHVSRSLRLETVRLSASSGLRHGRNRLVARVHTRAGGIQRVVLVVRIPDRRPIAGAGADQRAYVDGRVRLDGSSSLPPRAGSGAGCGFAGGSCGRRAGRGRGSWARAAGARSSVPICPVHSPSS